MRDGLPNERIRAYLETNAAEMPERLERILFETHAADVSLPRGAASEGCPDL